MAGFAAISAVGLSLRSLLTTAFTRTPPVPDSTTVYLVRTDDLDLKAATEIVMPAVSLLLYRIDVDRSSRPGWVAQGAADGRAYLPLNLHYLVTAWAENAEYEHLIIGRSAQVLHTYPMLTGPLLHPAGDWAPLDAVEIALDEVRLEDMMRVYEALEIHYRLSIPYLARVVVIAEPDLLPTGDVRLLELDVAPMAGVG